MDMFSQLNTFVRVVEANSLSGAARRLTLSLPAVSRQLRALESTLGAPLLVRTTRRIALTDRGREFYESSVRILRELDEARARVDPSKLAGVLVVSAPVSIALERVVPRLPALAKRHPDLAIDLRLEDRLVDFVREGVDVAIRGGAPPPDSTGYVAHTLARFRRTAVAAPTYARRRKLPRTPDQLKAHGCLLQSGAAGPKMTWALERVGDPRVRREVSVTGPVRSTAPIALRQLARAGVGVALLADWLVASDLADGTLKRVLPEWHSPEVAIWAVHRMEQKGSPRIAAFLEAMRQTEA